MAGSKKKVPNDNPPFVDIFSAKHAFLQRTLHDTYAQYTKLLSEQLRITDKSDYEFVNDRFIKFIESQFSQIVDVSIREAMKSNKKEKIFGDLQIKSNQKMDLIIPLIELYVYKHLTNIASVFIDELSSKIHHSVHFSADLDRQVKNTYDEKMITTSYYAIERSISSIENKIDKYYTLLQGLESKLERAI